MDNSNRSNAHHDPSSIFQLATAYWGSSVLLTANRLNLFTLLNEKKNVGEISDLLQSSHRHTEQFLNALVSLNLLEKHEEIYQNSAMASAFLVKGKPAYLGDAIKYSDDLYSVWGNLEKTVLKGEPALKPETILGENPEKTRNFIMGMHNRALGVGKCLCFKIDLTGRKKLLDVGGGPATYSVLLAQRNPQIHAVVMDLPKVTEIAREIIKEFDMENRVDLYPGDYRTTPFPEGHDTLLSSGTFHRETPDSCRKLLKKAFDALEPGGKIIINDVFCNKEKDGPAFVMLFGINMMLTSDHGTVHSTFEIEQWLREAGFVNISSDPLPPPMPHTVIQGDKP